MRVSGVRSSCDALASSILCDLTSSSMRAAERLKLAASAAISSLPSTFTRDARSPSPSWSTPAFSRSSRRVRRRVSGQAPSATASAMAASAPSSQAPGRHGPRSMPVTRKRPSGSDATAAVSADASGRRASSRRQRPPGGRDQLAVGRRARDRRAAAVQLLDRACCCARGASTGGSAVAANSPATGACRRTRARRTPRQRPPIAAVTITRIAMIVT